MATSIDQGRTFGPAARVSEDNWQLSGCPDDGPSLAVDARDVVHVAWPTFLSDAEQKAVFYTWTADARSFAPRIRLSGSDREDAGHPQIALDGAGAVAVVWDEQRGDDRKIVVRRAAGRGEFGAARCSTRLGQPCIQSSRASSRGSSWPGLNPRMAGRRFGSAGSADAAIVRGSMFYLFWSRWPWSRCRFPPASSCPAGPARAST